MFGIKKYIYSLRKKYFFSFCLYKNVAQKQLYINVNNNDSHQQKKTSTFLYIYKAKKMLNVYIYIQKARHFSKSKTIYVAFLLTKSHTLYVTRFFMKFLKLADIYIQKA